MSAVTEQQLRDALQNMVGHFKDETVLGRIKSFVALPEIDYSDEDRIAYYPVPDTFRHDIKAARAALALPDSGEDKSPRLALARDLRVGDEIHVTGISPEERWRTYVIGFDGPDPTLMHLDQKGRVASMGSPPWYNFDATGYVFVHRMGEPMEETS